MLAETMLVVQIQHVIVSFVLKMNMFLIILAKHVPQVLIMLMEIWQVGRTQSAIVFFVTITTELKVTNV